MSEAEVTRTKTIHPFHPSPITTASPNCQGIWDEGSHHTWVDVQANSIWISKGLGCNSLYLYLIYFAFFYSISKHYLSFLWLSFSLLVLIKSSKGVEAGSLLYSTVPEMGVVHPSTRIMDALLIEKFRATKLEGSWLLLSPGTINLKQYQWLKYFSFKEYFVGLCSK